jgi:alpha-1,2-mannosyltransferase
MKELKERYDAQKKDSAVPPAVLLIFGSTRNAEDRALAASLRSYAASLSLDTDYVYLIENSPYELITYFLSISTIGLHTMWNEHFGISIVEMMAAGLITIAHNSGGPKDDIIRPVNEVGYLATTESEYAGILWSILEKIAIFSQKDHPQNSTVRQELANVRELARKQSMKFSDELFHEKILEKLATVI